MPIAYCRAIRIEMPLCTRRAPHAPYLLTSSRSAVASVNASRWYARFATYCVDAAMSHVTAAAFAGPAETVWYCWFDAAVLMAGKIDSVALP